MKYDYCWFQVELNVGGKISYGSLFYVEEQFRMFGYGRRINDVASEAGNEHGFVVGIDAHDELEPMNNRRGYRTAFKVTQYQGQVTDQHAANPTNVVEVKRIWNEQQLFYLLTIDGLRTKLCCSRNLNHDLYMY